MKKYFFRGIKIVFLFLFISNCQRAYPSEETKSIDIRSLSLGQMNALSQLLNPAYLSFSERIQIGASVFNRFEMKELNTRSVFGLIPNRLLNMSFHLSAFGYSDYQLIEGQAGFAKKLSSNISIGTAVSYFVESSILEENTHSHLKADVSFLWRISDALDLALTTENLIHTRNSQPVSCFSGLKYQLNPVTCILLESGIDSQKRFNVSAGLEYEIVENITVRGGFRSNPRMPSFGIAYQMTHWSIETAFLFHPALGLSSGISINYFF